MVKVKIINIITALEYAISEAEEWRYDSRGQEYDEDDTEMVKARKVLEDLKDTQLQGWDSISQATGGNTGQQ